MRSGGGSGIDKAVRRTWIVSLLMALALMVNVTYVQGFAAQSLRDDPLNARQYEDRDKIERGPIIAGGERLAWSEPVAGGRRYQRRYRQSEIFAPVTGYFSRFSQTGLENAANHVLDGTDPRLATTDLINKIIGRRVPGGAVVATIDADAQRIAHAALRRSGARRAAAVVLDARTGAVRVLASTPSFDANEVSVHDVERAGAAFARLERDPLKPLLDKATREVFPPGSTFKTVVAAAAIAAGGSAAGRVRAGRDYRPPGSGQAINNDAADIGGECDRSAIPLIASFAQSCNTTFAYMGAEEPGNAAVAEQADRFGFHAPIAIEKGMSGAPSSFPRTDQPSLSALGAIGQGSTVASPLQMAMVAAGVLNGGEVMEPYLIEELRGSDGSAVEHASPHRLSQALSPGAAEQLREMMKAVVDEGTARSLRGGRIAGGKTGTADVEGASYNDRWFIGFGPGAGPRYAVAVMTEKAGYGIESGPIAAEIVGALED